MKIGRVLLKEAQSQNFRLVVAGGGAGGLAVGSHFARLLPSYNVAIIEPAKDHYYQPGLSMVGAGIWTLDQIRRNESDLIPAKAVWIPQRIDKFQPKNNRILLENGSMISYEFLVIATGLELRYDLIAGLAPINDTILSADSGICSIYSPKFAAKTFEEIRKFESGVALFTFPNTPIKCPGAPQKICYMADEYLRKKGKREKSRLIFNSALGGIFGVKKYAKVLAEMVQAKNIETNFRYNLTQVNLKQRIATFELLDAEAKPRGENVDFEYSLLHITPPSSPVKSLRDHSKTDSKLTDSNGWVAVNPKTLQSEHFDNVFGIGDCTACHSTKTAAAISSQFRVIKANLGAKLAGKENVVPKEYDGYTSCPLLVDYNHVILAEFDYSGQPLETFPFDQSKPSRVAFFLKRYIMPHLYWRLLLKGRWNGPAAFRRFFQGIKGGAAQK